MKQAFWVVHIFLKSFSFENKELQERYLQWEKPSHYLQITAVTFLTAVLYALYAFVDYLTVPLELRSSMIFIHLGINTSALFLISFLAYKKISFSLITCLLFLAPIVAALGNVYILSEIKDVPSYLTENYLIIFWIFTISGLSFVYAIFSALTVIVAISTLIYIYVPLTETEMTMHFFWMFCSFAFGLLGAYLIEKSHQTIFSHQESLELLVVTDKLTGLYNRSKLDEVLTYELEQGKRYNKAFGLVIMDIDFFKRVNDIHGHAQGDKVLIALSTLIKNRLRATDLAVRWGGEEFVFIYPQTALEDLLHLVEMQRKEIEAYEFENNLRQTASFGVTMSQEHDSINSILHRADKALYKAKLRGRNCIEIN